MSRSAGDDRPLIEQVAIAAHGAWSRQLGHEPVPWERLRYIDRARWTEIADAAVSAWVLGQNDMLIRRRQGDVP